MDGTFAMNRFLIKCENLDIGDVLFASSVAKKIKQEKAAALNTFLPEATNRLGGFSDACHRLAAATTISIGKEEILIDEMDRILG